MVYIPQTWINLPSKETPISAERLNYMEAGIAASGTGLPGPKGDKGDVGARGATGPQGDQGIAGAQGLTGETGQRGAQGVKGDKGADGTSVTIKGSVANAAALPPTGNAVGDGWITKDTGNLHIWDGTGFNDVGTVKGPKGDQGTQGVQGNQGPKGDPGATAVATETTNGLMSSTDKQRLTNASHLPNPVTLAKHDNEGHLFAKEPAIDEHVVNKAYADRAILNATAGGRPGVIIDEVNVPQSLNVTLPVGRFKVTPFITATAITTVPGTVVLGPSVQQMTSESFTLYLTRTNTTTTGVCWIAVVEDTNVEPLRARNREEPEPFVTVQKMCEVEGCPNKGYSIAVAATSQRTICGVCETVIP